MRLPDFRRPYTTQAELEQNDHREDAAHFRIVFRLVRDPKRDEGDFLCKMSIETLENS